MRKLITESFTPTFFRGYWWPGTWLVPAFNIVSGIIVTVKSLLMVIGSLVANTGFLAVPYPRCGKLCCQTL